MFSALASAVNPPILYGKEGVVVEELESQERIGQFLVRIGAMTEEQVADVLDVQEADPHTLFGMIATEKGYIDDKALRAWLTAKGGRAPGKAE